VSPKGFGYSGVQGFQSVKGPKYLPRARRESIPVHSSCTMTKKKQKIGHGQKTISGFVSVPEPVVEEQADVAKNALTFNDNWQKDPQYKWLYRDPCVRELREPNIFRPAPPARELCSPHNTPPTPSSISGEIRWRLPGSVAK
jgi:hypothetical protein